MKLLLVEDDPHIVAVVRRGLTDAGFTVDVAEDGLSGCDLGLKEPYDAAIIDIMLPKMNGLELISRIRGADKRYPILILSAKGTVEDRVKGLETGSDDYLIKPFALPELLARIQALIRRSQKLTEPIRLGVDGLTMDLVTREVWRGKEKIELQPREFTLLEYLMRNAGKIISKKMIIEQVWNYEFDPETNIVEARICRLREKIETEKEKWIRTIRGVGYIFQAHLEKTS